MKLPRILTLAITLIITGCSAPQNAQNQIHTITTITDIKGSTDNLPTGSLVAFDVDFVLTAPADKIGLPESKPIRQQIYKKYSKKIGKKKAELLFITFNKLTKRPLIEPETLNIVQGLKKRDIHTIAVSAISTKPIGPISDPLTFRVSHLHNIGVHFTDVLNKQKQYWGKDSGIWQGIILSGKQAKGGAIKYYFQNIFHHKAAHIVFIDDKLSNVQNVQEMCKQENIPFTGFHYVAATFKNNKADPKVAHAQFKHLHETGKWLSDIEMEK